MARRLVMALLSGLAPVLASAQASPPGPLGPRVPTPAASAPLARPAALLEGATIDGKPFGLAALRGRVVLVLHWSTDCAVCRDKMPELRRNAEGWRGRPFELVLVSHDRRVQDLFAYEQILASTTPGAPRFLQLWSGGAGYRDSFGRPAQLPAAWLIDKSGRVVRHWAGRIPPEAWDDIADLL